MIKNNSQHVLVVDDSQEIRDLKRDILEMEGYQVSTRGRRNTSMSDIVEIAPDLLVLEYVPDEHSPLMDDLINGPATQGIPILFSTVAVKRSDLHPPQVNSARFKIIAKPFDIDDFLADVHELLQAD